MRILLTLFGMVCGFTFAFMTRHPRGKAILADAYQQAADIVSSPVADPSGGANEATSSTSSLDDKRLSLDRHGFEYWPPRLDQAYPDLLLRDQNGKLIKLSQLAGKPILIELVAIPCEGCQAFAGGNSLGSFSGVPVQKGLGSIHEYAQQFGNVELGADIAFVQLLLYGKDLNAPTLEQTQAWATHFQMDARKRQLVLQGTNEMLGPETISLIPGFQLIDRDFVLRYDSSGHHPTHDLYRQLLPAIRELL